ncbi:MAG: sugar phosphate nucleotidyltransferase [Thermoleophilia bacterium]|mgnify:CR=1 FL=1
MKVVLFCGGKGLRMREASRRIPKPMIRIGDRPVLWHVMKYFAHHGHTEFILCLGHKQEAIKEYFLSYNEALSNDFVLSGGGTRVRLLNEDIADWRITFVDTGYSANVGERLRRVREHIGRDEYFLANYGDVLTDAPLDRMIGHALSRVNIASFLMVRPSYTFHTVTADEDGRVSAVKDVVESDLWVNGGYFVLNRRIFDYMEPGEELVTDVFAKLVRDGQLSAWRHEGFWAPMDTLKEQQELEALVEAGGGPWRVWERGRTGTRG